MLRNEYEANQSLQPSARPQWLAPAPKRRKTYGILAIIRRHGAWFQRLVRR